MANPIPTSNLLLAALPEEERARLMPLLRPVTLESGANLLTSGEPIANVYFPLGGVCSLTVTMEDGRVAEVGVTGREGVVGYLAAYGQHVASHDAMVQIPGGPALALARRDFLEAIGRGSSLRALVDKFMLGINVMTSMSVGCNALHTAEERCARWLLHAHDRAGVPRFDLSHEFLAMMLGVRRPTATIAAGILQSAGMIRYRRAHMEIVDRHHLEEASCECYRAISAHFEALLPPPAVDSAAPASYS